jgi:hypothetical protein
MQRLAQELCFGPAQESLGFRIQRDHVSPRVDQKHGVGGGVEQVSKLHLLPGIPAHGWPNLRIIGAQGSCWKQVSALGGVSDMGDSPTRCLGLQPLRIP